MSARLREARVPLDGHGQALLTLSVEVAPSMSRKEPVFLVTLELTQLVGVRANGRAVLATTWVADG